MEQCWNIVKGHASKQDCPVLIMIWYPLDSVPLSCHLDPSDPTDPGSFGVFWILNWPQRTWKVKTWVSNNTGFNNSHNFKYNWYPFWNLVTTRIAALVEKHHCFMAPQCILWRLHDPREDPRKPGIHKVHIGNNIDMEGVEVGENGEDLEVIGDASFSSIALTITRVQDWKRITDFLLFWSGKILLGMTRMRRMRPWPLMTTPRVMLNQRVNPGSLWG